MSYDSDSDSDIRDAMARLRVAALSLGDKLAGNANAKTDDEARELEAAAVAYRKLYRRREAVDRVADGLAELAAAPLNETSDGELEELMRKLAEMRARVLASEAR